MKEEHVPNEGTVSHLEKIDWRIFEVKWITFLDDELHLEGTGHNQCIHITVTRDLSCHLILTDRGFGENIFPFYTLPNKILVQK